MSSGAALAAAHRRRAGGAKGMPNQANTKLMEKQQPKQPISIETLVIQHDKQIDVLRNNYLDHSEHWEQCDQFLKTMAENSDTVNGRLTAIEKGGSNNPDIKNEIDGLSKKTDELVRSTATKDEVMGLISSVKDELLLKNDTDEDSEQTKKISKLEAEVTKLKSIIMQLQTDMATIKGEVSKGRNKKGNNDN